MKVKLHLFLILALDEGEFPVRRFEKEHHVPVSQDQWAEQPVGTPQWKTCKV
jgi:hypothetical protein